MAEPVEELVPARGGAAGVPADEGAAGGGAAALVEPLLGGISTSPSPSSEVADDEVSPGERFSGALFARLVKDSIVRDLLAAGLEGLLVFACI